MKNLLLYISIFAYMSCGSNANTDTAKATTDKTKAQVQVAAKPNQVKRVQKPQAQRNKPAAQTVQDYKPKNEGWLVDINEAYAQSQKTGKPIMANFTGSDWCGWCKRLDKSVFHQAEFKKWAKKNVVLIELDFPRRFRVPESIATQNRDLARSFGVRGYPTVWLFDLDKDAQGQFQIKGLGKTGYTKTFGEFEQTMDSYISARSKSS